MSDWPTVALSALQLLIITLFVALHTRNRSLDPFAPIWAVLACQALTFGVRPILLCFDQARFGAFWPIVGFDQGGFHFASVCGLIATLGLIVGYEAAIRRPPFCLKLQEVASPALTLGLSTVGMLLAVVSIRSALGRSEVSFETAQLMTGQARGEIGRQMPGHGYETFAWVCVPVYVGAVAAAYLGNGRRKTLVPMLFLVAGVAILLPIGGRSTLTQTLGIAAYVWHYRVKPFRARWAVAFGVGAFVLSAAVGDLRQGFDAGQSVPEAVGRTSMSFDGFEGVVAISRRLALEDVIWGHSYLEDVCYTMIPRAIWSGKPRIYGSLRCEEYVYPDLIAAYGDVGTYPVGYLAEALLNFWYIGIAVVPAVLGIFLAFLERAVKGSPHLVYPVILAALVVGDCISLVRGIGQFAIEILTLPTLFAALRVLRPNAAMVRARVATT